MTNTRTGLEITQAKEKAKSGKVDNLLVWAQKKYRHNTNLHQFLSNRNCFDTSAIVILAINRYEDMIDDHMYHLNRFRDDMSNKLAYTTMCGGSDEDGAYG